MAFKGQHHLREITPRRMIFEAVVFLRIRPFLAWCFHRRDSDGASGTKTDVQTFQVHTTGYGSGRLLSRLGVRLRLPK